MRKSLVFDIIFKGENHIKTSSQKKRKWNIIDKVIVIHENKDDFTTQPSGNSGTKIGCGRIVVVKTKIKY